MLCEPVGARRAPCAQRQPARAIALRFFILWERLPSSTGPASGPCAVHDYCRVQALSLVVALASMHLRHRRLGFAAVRPCCGPRPDGHGIHRRLHAIKLPWYRRPWWGTASAILRVSCACPATVLRGPCFGHESGIWQCPVPAQSLRTRTISQQPKLLALLDASSASKPARPWCQVVARARNECARPAIARPPVRRRI